LIEPKKYKEARDHPEPFQQTKWHEAIRKEVWRYGTTQSLQENQEGKHTKRMPLC
jgi:hypothetical protein